MTSLVSSSLIITAPPPAADTDQRGLASQGPWHCTWGCTSSGARGRPGHTTTTSTKAGYITTSTGSRLLAVIDVFLHTQHQQLQLLQVLSGCSQQIHIPPHKTCQLVKAPLLLVLLLLAMGTVGRVLVLLLLPARISSSTEATTASNCNTTCCDCWLRRGKQAVRGDVWRHATGASSSTTGDTPTGRHLPWRRFAQHTASTTGNISGSDKCPSTGVSLLLLLLLKSCNHSHWSWLASSNSARLSSSGGHLCHRLW